MWAKDHVAGRDIKSLADLGTRAGTLVHEIMHMANLEGKWKINKKKRKETQDGSLLTF